MTHTIRTIRCTLHGFVASQATHGFEWSQHPEETSGWIIRFIDYSLRAIRHHPEDDAAGAPSAQIISLCLEKMMDIQPAPGAQSGGYARDGLDQRSSRCATSLPDSERVGAEPV